MTTTNTDQVVETKIDDEYNVGEEGAIPLSGEEEGVVVADGSYVVPKGVAVEELKNYNGHRKLRDECPEAVNQMLSEKDLFDTYDKLVQALCDDKSTRGPLGKWKDAQVIGVLDLFRDEFAEKGVQVAFCKRKSGKGSYRWFEFIDIAATEGSYVPQYDLSNLSGQVIRTAHTQLKFPNGVAVEELKQWNGRRKLKESVPIYVERLLEKKNLKEEYDQMIDHVIEAGVGSNFKNWNLAKLRELMNVYKPKFADKGVDIYVCHKEEYVSHGQYGGHTENFRWIEFVDREEQPSYQPQRSADLKDETCAII